MWEDRERNTTKGPCMGRGDDDYDNYKPLQLESDAVAASSYSEAEIPFTFRGKEAVVTAVDTTRLWIRGR